MPPSTSEPKRQQQGDLIAMHSLKKFSIGLLIALLLCVSYLGIHTAHAAQLRPTAPCNVYGYLSGRLSNVHTYYETSAHCGSNNATVYTWLANCDTYSHDAEADTWQTQVTHSGGTRYADSGRSGWVTYPPNCVSYYTQESYLSFWQLADPSYGCTWFAVSDNVYYSLDYQCGLFPTR
jgi:hypothetical protein